MKRLSMLATVVGLLGLAVSGQGQPRGFVNNEAANQLGLLSAWSLALPRSDPRDEVLYAQLLDVDLLVLQFRSGTVLAVDAITGLLRWQVSVGRPFAVYQRPACVSERLVIVPADLTLHIYERKSGVQLWRVELNDLPHRTPACDDAHLAVIEGASRVRCWLLPHVERYLASLAADRPVEKPSAARRSIYDAGVSSYEIRRQEIREPQRAWDFRDTSGFDVPPVSASDIYVAFANREGKLRVVASDESRLVGEWQLPGSIPAPLAFRLVERREGNLSIWESWLFVACTDNALYAFQLHQGKLTPVWQRTVGAVAHVEPILLEDQVYLVTANRGLFCLDRDTGQIRWHQPEVQEFLAASARLVVAQDRNGRPVTLDRQRGHITSRAEWPGKVQVIPNHFTDRVYVILNGHLHCCYDRAAQRGEPRVYYRLRFRPPPAQLAKPAEKAEPEPAKPEEKP